MHFQWDAQRAQSEAKCWGKFHFVIDDGVFFNIFIRKLAAHAFVLVKTNNLKISSQVIWLWPEFISLFCWIQVLNLNIIRDECVAAAIPCYCRASHSAHMKSKWRNWWYFCSSIWFFRVIYLLSSFISDIWLLLYVIVISCTRSWSVFSPRLYESRKLQNKIGR